MKKIIYIILFVFLGILLQLILHGFIEVFYIKLLLSDFEKYGLGFSWNIWETIHYVGALLFFFGGLAFGLQQGVYWWKRIYEKE